MSKYFVNKDMKQPNPMAVLYHKEWIAKIKKSLGSNCTFLQHVRKDKVSLVDRLFQGTEIVVKPKSVITKSDYFLEARFGKKRITFKIEGTPTDVSNENYLNLQKQLLGYARTEKLI